MSTSRSYLIESLPRKSKWILYGGEFEGEYVATGRMGKEKLQKKRETCCVRSWRTTLKHDVVDFKGATTNSISSIFSFLISNTNCETVNELGYSEKRRKRDQIKHKWQHQVDGFVCPDQQSCSSSLCGYHLCEVWGTELSGIYAYLLHYGSD